MAIPQSHSWLHGVQFFHLATCSKLSKLSNCGLAGHHGFSAAFPWNISWEGCRDGVLHRLTVFNGTRFSRSLCYGTKPASSVRSIKRTVKWESIPNQCDFEFQFLIQFWLDFCFQFCLTLYAGSGLTEEDGTSRMSLFAQGFKECLVSETMRGSGNLLLCRFASNSRTIICQSNRWWQLATEGRSRQKAVKKSKRYTDLLHSVELV